MTITQSDYVERVLIVLNPDGSFKGAAAYDVSGLPVDLPVEALAAALPDTASLLARIRGAEAERDAAQTAKGEAEAARDAALAARDDLQARINADVPSASVSPLQARKALLAAGLLDEVEAAIAASPRDVQLAWEYAISFERTSPLIAGLGAQLGLSDQQIDELFSVASSL